MVRNLASALGLARGDCTDIRAIWWTRAAGYGIVSGRKGRHARFRTGSRTIMVSVLSAPGGVM